MIEWTFITTTALSALSGSTVTRSSESFFSDSGVIQTSAFQNATWGTTERFFTESHFTESNIIIQVGGLSTETQSGTSEGGSTTSAAGTASSFTQTNSSSAVTLISPGTSSGTSGSTSTTRSGALGTARNQTTTTTTSVAHYSISTTSTFSSSFLSSSSITNSTGTTSAPAEIDGTYTDVTSTTATSMASTITTSLGATFDNSYNTTQVQGYLPARGEIAWITSASFAPSPVSSLLSETSSFSLIQSSNFATLIPVLTTGNTTNPNSFTSSSSLAITQTSSTQSFYASDFGVGGITSAAGTSGQDIVTTITFMTLASFSTTSNTSTFATDTMTATAVVTQSSVSTFFLQQYQANKTAHFTSTTEPTTVTAVSNITLTTTVASSLGAFTSSHSGISTGIGAGTTTSVSVGFGITLNSPAGNGNTGGIALFHGSALGLTVSPNSGFRTNPTGDLASQIGIAHTSVSLAFSEGSNVFSLAQTVPVTWPAPQSWIDSNAVSYTASFSSGSLTLTAKSSSTHAVGTSTLTSFSSSSFTDQWTSAGLQTQTLFDLLGGTSILLGSGSYYTDLTEPSTVILPVGYYGSSMGSTAVTASTSFTLSSGDVIRDLTMASFDPQLTNPFVVEIVSNFNR